MHWYAEVLRKYMVFEGRASRKEFWWFTVYDTIISLTLIVLQVMVSSSGEAVGPITMIYFIPTLIPRIAVHVRRFHDINRSGFWLALWLIPFVGQIIGLIMLLKAGTKARNRFGEPCEYFA